MDNSQFIAGIICIVLLSMALFTALSIFYFLILTFNDEPKKAIEFQEMKLSELFEPEEGK